MTIEKVSKHQITILRFRDGDTCDVVLRCGCCGAARFEALRLAQIESWELRSEQHARAAHTAQVLTGRYKGESGILDRTSLRLDRYGRIIGDVLLPTGSLARAIVDAGLAWYGVGTADPGVIVTPSDNRTPVDQ